MHHLHDQAVLLPEAQVGVDAEVERGVAALVLADELPVHPDLAVVVDRPKVKKYGPVGPIRRRLEPLAVPAAPELPGLRGRKLGLPARRHRDRAHLLRQPIRRIGFSGVGRKLPTAIQGDLDAGHSREGSSLIGIGVR